MYAFAVIVRYMHAKNYTSRTKYRASWQWE